MYRASYLETVEDAGSAGRAREAIVLGRAIERLERSAALAPGEPDRIAALRFVQEVWRFLIADLANPENALPGPLKADLVSIGLWIMAESHRLIAGEKDDMRPLIEIVATVRAGLAAEPEERA